MRKVVSFLIVFSLLGVFFAPAQAQKKSRQRRSTKPNTVLTAKNQKRVLKTDTSALTTPTPTPPPTVNPSPFPTPNLTAGIVDLPTSKTEEISGDIQSGNVIVNVSSNGNAVIKIGLAARGVTVIDFPASDPVYRIHPGDENFVTVGCTAREENGKCGNSPTDAIILRPGKNFHTLDTEESAATVVTIQRVSGIVVSFIVVPVKSIAQNTNYVVVRYNLSDVIEARLKAGLAVNLQPGVLTIPNVVPTGDGDKSNKTENQYLDTSINNSSNENDKPSEETSLAETVIAELQRVAQNESDLRFLKPVYGISLARASTVSRVTDVTIEVVAVRNTLPKAIRLVPDQPELVIENREKKEASVNIQRVNLLHIATTAEADDVLLPGQVYYYAFAYASPILGVKQVLRVSFAQREAADAPASIELSGLAR